MWGRVRAVRRRGSHWKIRREIKQISDQIKQEPRKGEMSQESWQQNDNVWRNWVH